MTDEPPFDSTDDVVDAYYDTGAYLTDPTRPGAQIEPQFISDAAMKALRWAAWSWGDPRVPEPPCPTDDEFDRIAERFGYRIDRGNYDDEQ